MENEEIQSPEDYQRVMDKHKGAAALLAAIIKTLMSVEDEQFKKAFVLTLLHSIASDFVDLVETEEKTFNDRK